jgi:hypothetical protein
MFILADDRISSGSIRYIVHFIVFCRRLLMSQGPKGLTLYLKAAGVSVQQSIGGHVVYNPRRLGCAIARTNRGLPRFIPPVIRMRIRAGDPTAIRITLTLINLYRVIEFPGTLKIGTITKGHTGHGGLDKEILSYMPLFAKLFVYERFSETTVWNKLNEFSRHSVFAMFKGGPGVQGALGQWNTMPWIMLRALKALVADPTLKEALDTILGALEFPKVLNAVNLAGGVVGLQWQGKDLVKPLPYLGKLGTKAEAAGKIRVFAMVDAWTQWALYPFHKLAFMLLEGIPMDGTFDQLAPLSRVNTSKGVFSLDLSAATDRIPVWIQKNLWSYIIGHELASAWRNLLVGRVYRLHTNDSYSDLRYAVGQPMGALSSWASLALIHHFLVQAAAWRAGYPKWKLYRNYAILGDDVVIGDRKVVLQYLEILSSLGVECGLHKSLLSHRGLALEFAKRTIFKGVDVSPVPVKEFYAGSIHLGAFVELSKKYRQPLHRMLQALDAGWQVRSWLDKPLGKLSSRVRLLILAINVPSTPEQAKAFFALGAPKLARFHADVVQVTTTFVQTEFSRLYNKLVLSSNRVLEFNPASWAESQVIALGESLGIKPKPLDTSGWIKGDGFVMSPVYFGPLAGFHDVGPNTILAPGTKFWAGRLLSDSLTGLANLTWRPAKEENFKEAQAMIRRLYAFETSEFEAAYVELISLQAEIAKRSFHVFSTVRPNPPEMKGIMDPSQIRLWKRWSAILQGSKALPKADE